MHTTQLLPSIQQQQTLSPRLQHAVRLLQMSSLDFSALVRGKLDENPFLEALDDDDPSTMAPSADTPPVLTAPTDDRDPWTAQPVDRPPARPDVERLGGQGLVSDRPLNRHLHEQLDEMRLTECDSCIARAIVESLDDDGYLRSPLDELALMLPLSPPPTRAEWRIGLRLVQSLEPAGVGARHVGECLALQCGGIEDPVIRQLALAIVTRHLDALAAGDMSRLSDNLGVPIVRVERAATAIRRLHPRPGRAIDTARADYIVPDVIVRRVADRWQVQLNPAVVPRVRLHHQYARMLQHHRPGDHPQLQAHLQEARWTLRNVRQRYSTILDVATAIVQRQHRFLLYGDMAMQPLMLREIADDIQAHESTVSRVTSNKYMATPLGTFEFKHFFSRAWVTDSGQPCSATAIRALIAELIAREAPERPHSDGELARQLMAQGLPVARRTVTKYRQQLKISAAPQRRRPA